MNLLKKCSGVESTATGSQWHCAALPVAVDFPRGGLAALSRL